MRGDDDAKGGDDAERGDRAPPSPQKTALKWALEADTEAAFAALWGAVNASRAAEWSHGTRDAQPAPRQFAGWWAELKRAVPPALRVGALRAGDCADTDSCLGLGRDGHCVCNRH